MLNSIADSPELPRLAAWSLRACSIRIEDTSAPFEELADSMTEALEFGSRLRWGGVR